MDQEGSEDVEDTISSNPFSGRGDFIQDVVSSGGQQIADDNSEEYQKLSQQHYYDADLRNPFSGSEVNYSLVLDRGGLEISVSSWDRRETPTDSFTVYKIDVKHQGAVKVIWKRFSQFLVLNESLKRHHPTEILPTFPEKTLFNSDSELIKKRREQLDLYMKELLQNAKLRSNFQVKSFLEVVDMRGRVCIVTGASSGIGREAALALAKFGAHVILACRSEEKTMPIVKSIQTESDNPDVEFMKLDLASFDSIRSFAFQFKDRNLPLHVLVNNAGLVGGSGRTENNFETTFGVNHLGHFLLTDILLPILKRSAPSRIVTVSSDTHRAVEEMDYSGVENDTNWLNTKWAYTFSKLANVLFTYELSRRLDSTGVTATCLHPGGVATDIYRNMQWLLWVMKPFLITEEEGASTILYCACAPDLVIETGKYYIDCKEVLSSDLSYDADVARDLWEKSEIFCGLKKRVVPAETNLEEHEKEHNEHHNEHYDEHHEHHHHEELEEQLHEHDDDQDKHEESF